MVIIIQILKYYIAVGTLCKNGGTWEEFWEFVSKLQEKENLMTSVSSKQLSVLCAGLCLIGPHKLKGVALLGGITFLE